jgi:hypothetical protein
MCFIQIVHAIVDPLIDFTAKNVVYYYGLEPIRKTLEKTILDVALTRLGSFVAPLFATQAALMVAPQVTLFIGQCWGFALKEIISSIEDLAQAIFGVPAARVEYTWARIAMSIASFVTSTIARNYFYNFGTPFIASGLQILFTRAICTSFVSAALLPAFVVLAAPAVTFLVGDIIGSIVQYTTYTLLDWVWTYLSV